MTEQAKHTAEWPSAELERAACEAQETWDNPLAQVAFRAGVLLCREYMARFVEQGGDAAAAASIRANWIPALGDDPGAPRRFAFDECVEAEDMENGPWRSKNPGLNREAACYALIVMHDLGMALPEEVAIAKSEQSNG